MGTRVHMTSACSVCVRVWVYACTYPVYVARVRAYACVRACTVHARNKHCECVPNALMDACSRLTSMCGIRVSCMCITYACIRARICVCVHIDCVYVACVCTRACLRVWTHVHACTYPVRVACVYARTHACVCGCIRAHVHKQCVWCMCSSV